MGVLVSKNKNENQVNSNSSSTISSTPSNADTPRTQQAKEAKKSQKKKEKSDQILTKLLNGDLTIDVPSQAKLIRIYISANSKDTTAERNALMTRVYPKLKEYCQSIGYDFQVVDMRWGVRDEATADHMTSELCMKELQLCQDISAGPSFVSFLSHKYGYRPFPPKIVATEFETMLKVVEEQTDKDLLQKWFLKDENSIPEMYILQPITEVLTNYENPEASKKQRSKATGEWFKSFNQMQLVLRDASNKVLSEEDAIKYSISVTENEIEQGCSEIKNPDDSAYWFNRTIMDIARYQDDKASRMFIDKNGQEIDQNAIDLVNDLRENKLPSMLSSNSITTYDLSWLPEFGVDPEQSELHKEYLDKLCVDFERIMKEKIDRCITKRDNSLSDDEVVGEIIHHQSFCRQKVSEFTGRRKLLMKILPLLDDDDEDEEVGEMKLQEVGANETGEQKKVEDRPAVDTTEKEQKERQAVDTTEKEQKERKGKETEEESEQKEEENDEEDEEEQTRKGKGKKGRKQQNKQQQKQQQQNQQKRGKGKGKKQKRFHDSDEEDEEKEEQPQQEQEKKPIKLCPDEERNSPIFIHGKPGSGLSSIMAKIALTANYEFPERLLITRFVGCTEGSIDLFELIYSICCQLKRALKMDVSSRPKALPEMIEQFHTILEETYEGGREILFIIDGLDKLNVGANQHTKWLMTRLPSNCRMLVSLSPNDEVLVSIKDEFKGSSFIEVGGLQPKACKSLINKWLSSNKRKLTDEQYGILSECYRKSPTPLFLRFCFDQVNKWKSYHDIEDCSLESNIKDSMDRIFSDLEKVHGQALVSHTIGLIRASRHGLSDTEIEDLLSIDDEVLNDIYQQWSPPMRRVSSFTWIQIRNALGFCLTRKNVNGIVLNTFSHSQIQDAASERYHKDADDLETFRELLVDYFMGTWSNGVCKPTSGAKGAGEPQGKDRLVASQPNRFKHENSHGEHYNYRKLSELPFHLMKLKDVEKIKDNLLFNFDFLVATMQALGVQALLNTVSEASKMFSNDEDISYLYSILTSALPVLEKFPDQLACQIAGRVDEEKASKAGGIIDMLERIKESDQPYFIPTKKCFQTEEVVSTPEGFKGHTDAINDVVVLDNGKKLLTVSEDKSLRIWKVDNSSEIQMNEFEDPIINVFPYQNDEKALLLFNSKLLAVNLSDFETIYEESFQGERIGALTPDGSRFVMLCTEKKNYRVVIYDVSKDELVKERDFEHPKSKAGVTGSHFKDQIKVNNEYIAFTSGTNESINLRKINDRKFTEEITPSSPFQIFSLSEDGTVRIMSVIEQKSRFKPKKVYFAILKIGERGQVGRQASEDIAEIEHEFVSKSLHLDLPNIDGGVQNKDMDPYPWGPDDYILVWMVYNSKQINLFGSQNKHERMVYELPISSKQKICHARILDSKRILVISKTSSKEPVIEILEADDLDIKSGPDLMEARETQYEDFKELEDEDEDEEEDEEGDEKSAVSAEAAGDGDILCLRNPNPNSNMMISIDPSEMLLNVWDTTLHVVTKSFSLGFVPKLMQFIDGNRVLMLNERKNSFMLLHVIEDEMVLKQQGSNDATQNAQSQDQLQNQQNGPPHQQAEQQQQDQGQPENTNHENNSQHQNDVFEDQVMFHSSDKYISRHITPGLNDKVVWIKQTNEFAITDERNNLKIFSLETGNQVELIETKMRDDCQRILGNQDGCIIVMFFSDEDQEKVSAHVYNMTTRSKVGEIERGVAFTSDFKLAALSENGQQLFIPNKEKNSILIFDVSNGSLLNTRPPFGNFNSSKTLPPFGKTLPPIGGYNPKTDTTITKKVLQTPATARKEAYLPPVLVAGVTTISKGVEYHFLRCYEDQTWQPLVEVRLPSAVVEVHFSASQDEKDGVYLLVETEESLLLFDFSAVVSHKTIQYVANLCLGDSKGCYQFCKRRIIAASVPKTERLVFFQLCNDEMVSPEQKHVKPVKL